MVPSPLCLITVSAGIAITARIRVARSPSRLGGILESGLARLQWR